MNYVYNSYRGVNPAGYLETGGALEMIGSKTMMGWINLDEIYGNTDLYFDSTPVIAVYKRLHPNIYKSAIYYSQDNGWGLFSSEHIPIYSNVVETSFDGWVHIASTHVDNDFKLYRNGELILTITDYPTVVFEANGAPNDGVGTKFTLAHMDFHYGGGLAKYDDVSLWHGALSQSDIQDIMSNGIDFNNYDYNYNPLKWKFNFKDKEGLQISPKLGLVYRPKENQNFRLTWAKAFNTPSNQALFLDIFVTRVATYKVYARGANNGYVYPRGENGNIFWKDPYDPFTLNEFDSTSHVFFFPTTDPNNRGIFKDKVLEQGGIYP